MSANFRHLRPDDAQLFRLGALAERCCLDDPNTALLKLRQLGEWLAQQTASRFALELRAEETQQVLLRRPEAEGCLDRQIAELLHVLRRKGNLANHQLQGDHATALKTLRIAWQLGVWFHRTFTDPDFRSGPFQPPQLPDDGDEAVTSRRVCCWRGSGRPPRRMRPASPRGVVAERLQPARIRACWRLPPCRPMVLPHSCANADP